MFDEIIKAINELTDSLSKKGLKFNIGFTDDSYWKIFVMLLGVILFAGLVQSFVPKN